MRIELRILESIKRNKRSVGLALLYMISRPYKWGVLLRHWFYDRGIFRQYRAKVPVVSVGNITAGGTGKTPFVMMMLETLKEKRVATLMRGYRKTSKGEGKVSDVSMGDEAYMVSRHFDRVYSVKNRAKFARDLEGVDMILLDDGFQHRKLKRDIDIVCMRRSDLFGHGYYLPRGLLRDDPKRLAKCDMICVSEIKTEYDMKKVKEKIRKYSSSTIVGVNFEASPLEQLDGTVVENQNLTVGVFCGLGHPAGFINSIKMPYVATLILPDHAPIDQNEIAMFAKKCREFGADALVCSEKDSVKCLGFPSMDLPIFVQKGKLKITSGISKYNALMENLSLR